MNKLASAVASYTPQLPISGEVAAEIHALVDATLHKLAEQVDQKLQSLGAAAEGSEEERVIIITSPPPPP
jgi:hypothetical protein